MLSDLAEKSVTSSATLRHRIFSRGFGWGKNSGETPLILRSFSFLISFPSHLQDS